MPKAIRDPAIPNHTDGTAERITEVRRQDALQDAIFNSANLSSRLGGANTPGTP